MTWWAMPILTNCEICCCMHRLQCRVYAQAAMQQLDAKDWTQAIQGLNIVRQAAVHHKQTLQPLL